MKWESPLSQVSPCSSFIASWWRCDISSRLSGTKWQNLKKHKCCFLAESALQLCKCKKTYDTCKGCFIARQASIRFPAFYVTLLLRSNLCHSLKVFSHCLSLNAITELWTLLCSIFVSTFLQNSHLPQENKYHTIPAPGWQFHAWVPYRTAQFFLAFSLPSVMDSASYVWTTKIKINMMLCNDV